MLEMLKYLLMEFVAQRADYLAFGYVILLFFCGIFIFLQRREQDVVPRHFWLGVLFVGLGLLKWGYVVVQQLLSPSVAWMTALSFGYALSAWFMVFLDWNLDSPKSGGAPNGRALVRWGLFLHAVFVTLFPLVVVLHMERAILSIVLIDVGRVGAIAGVGIVIVGQERLRRQRFCERMAVESPDRRLSKPILVSRNRICVAVGMWLVGCLIANALSLYKLKDHRRDLTLQMERYVMALQDRSQTTDRMVAYLASRDFVVNYRERIVLRGSEFVSRRLSGDCWAIAGSVCYLMNLDGMVIASSNWNSPNGFVGDNYGFRPYFSEARAGKLGRMMALGVTSGQRGYYASHPVYAVDGRIAAVVVVKRELEDIETHFSETHPVFLLDPHGVVFLSSLIEARLRPLWELPRATSEELLTNRQFGRIGLQPYLTDPPDVQGRVNLGGWWYVLASQDAFPGGWRFVALVPDLTGFFRQAAMSFLGFLMLGVVIYWFSKYTWESNLVEAIIARESQARIERQLWHSTKLASIGTLAAGMAHEINNPLAIISGSVTRLRSLVSSSARSGNSDSEVLFHDISDGIVRIAGIVDGLRTFSRSDNKPLAPVDIHDLIVQTIDMLRRMYSYSDIDFSMVLLSSPIYVAGNSGRIQQVLVNLVANARDAMRDRLNREIRVTTRRVPGFVEVCLADSGPGIPHEHLQRVFEPFFTTKQEGKGTGLGLSIVSSLVVSMGGEISVCNSDSGEGAMFTIRLVECEAPERVDSRCFAKIESGSIELKGVSVLVVEDERAIREFIDVVLRNTGAEVCFCCNGTAAKDELRRRSFDVLITDLSMPGGDGMTLLNSLASCENMGVVVITGHVLQPEQIPSGAVFLRKPFEISHFLDAIVEARKKV